MYLYDTTKTDILAVLILNKTT